MLLQLRFRFSLRQRCKAMLHHPAQYDLLIINSKALFQSWFTHMIYHGCDHNEWRTILSSLCWQHKTARHSLWSRLWWRQQTWWWVLSMCCSLVMAWPHVRKIPRSSLPHNWTVSISASQHWRISKRMMSLYLTMTSSFGSRANGKALSAA
jgi:hypothetical protein